MTNDDGWDLQNDYSPGEMIKDAAVLIEQILQTVEMDSAQWQALGTAYANLVAMGSKYEH